jgi:ABC-type branched-subunit amino acid transport system substrate-binding protein
MKALPSPFISKIQFCVTCLIVLAALLLVWPDGPRVTARAPSTAQDTAEAQQKRGKQIYEQGTSASGREILAYLGEASLEVPGSAMACANCHALDGEGKPEGGVVPSNLTWEALTKPYGVTHASGRTHPPYTERALELAITRGLDPAGNHLMNIMPRYQMAREDMADLIAYLKQLGKTSAPGVTETSITIGTLVPTSGELAGAGQVIQAVTKALFEEVNSRGGIYNRKLELKVAETATTPATSSEKTRRFIQEQQVFALTGAFIAGADKEMAGLASDLQVPLVGPLTLYPQTGYPLNRYVFYLLSGVEQQARALVKFAAQRSMDQKAGSLLLYAEGGASAGVMEAIKDQCQKSPCGPLQTYGYQSAQFDAPAWAKRLSQTGSQTVYFSGTGADALKLMQEADKLSWSPSLYLTMTAVGQEMFNAPQSFNGKIFLPFPTSPNDQTAAGIEEFRTLAARYKLPDHHLVMQLSAYSAAKILVEGLKRAGRELSREKLVEALEGLDGYATGLVPPVTYGPNRRIGAMGAYVVTLDLEKRQFMPASSWVEIN